MDWSWLFGHGGGDENLENFLQKIRGGSQPSDITQNPLYQQGQNYYKNLLSGDPSAFANFEAPYMTQFNQQIAPGIANQYGGLGAASSSGFQQTLGQAGQGLSQNLAFLRSGLQGQAAQGALQYAQQPQANFLEQARIGSQSSKAPADPGVIGLTKDALFKKLFSFLGL